MSRIFLGMAFVLTAMGAVLAGSIQTDFGQRMNVAGRKMRVRIEGQGEPTVILENFGPAPLDIWTRVQPRVAQFTRVMAYDHAGYWGSDVGPKPRDAWQVVADLHATLQQAGVSPPYVLVGYSFGGPYVRVFARAHAAEVAGLVLVDPSQEEFFDYLRLHHPEVNRITQEDRTRQDEWGCSWDSLELARAAEPLPDVPILLLTCMRSEKGTLHSRLVPTWKNAHEQWVGRHRLARQQILTDCGHGVVLEQPQIVVEAIREVVMAARK